MKLLTFDAGGGNRLGLMVDEDIYDVAAIVQAVKEFKSFTKPIFFPAGVNEPQMLDVLTQGERALDGLRNMETFIRWHRDRGDPALLRNAKVDASAIKWRPPIVRPPLLYGIGGNSPLFFRDKQFQIPAYPRGFMRPITRYSLIGHMEEVIIPENYGTIRASAELGVVIGKPGRNIPAGKAMEHVFGYTIVNDMCSDSWKVVALGGRDEALMLRDITVFTARASTSYYSRSTDTFAAVGPYIVTRDEVVDPYNLLVYSRLSGVVRERSYTQAMVNGIEQTIEFLSRMFTLQPGMILHMGTMGIDGYTVEADMALGPEDYFEMEYEGIGALRNRVRDLRKQGEQ